ncbi:MAG TPA: cupin domain-containing protein [Polyangiaceae bacterium]|nr:cupin domain-containing protein [Polyangiaceae bacterium]
MKPFAPDAELPEFADEFANSDAERRQLAELFAQLSSLPAPEPSVLARGRARLLSTVDQSGERFAPLFDKLSRFFDLSADALRSLFVRAARETEWEPGPLPWVSLFHFQGGPAVAGCDTGFVRLQKGMPFPPHRHLGKERVLVLDGGYHDHEGHWYGPGDFHDMTDGTQHALQMNAERDVLLAVVLAGAIEVVSE